MSDDELPGEMQELKDEEIIEDQGFEPQEFTKPELFTIKPFQMVDFPSDEHIACFAINDHKIAVTTLSKKVYRWRIKDDPGCQEVTMGVDQGEHIGKQMLKLGETVGKGLGTGIMAVGNVFLDTVNLVTKPLFNTNLQFGKKGDLNESKLDKIFLEPKGTHMVVCSDKGDAYHISYYEEQMKPLKALQGRIIRYILWDQCTLQSFSNALLVSNDNKIYLYSLTWNNDRQIHSENLHRSLFQIPQDRLISDVKRIVRQHIVTLIFGTDQSIILMQGGKDMEQFFLRYKENVDLLKQGEHKFDKKSFGSLIIQFNQNLLWTDGFSLNYHKISEDLNINNFIDQHQMKYAKKYDGDLEKAYTVQEQLYGIGMTNYHYYLLTYDTVTIISLLTQNVVTHFDLNNKMMGKPIGMVYDQSTLCFWIYCKNGVYILNTELEDIEIWKLLVDMNNFGEALQAAKKYNSPYYGHIAGLYADVLFEDRKYLEAAKYYLLSSRQFQEVFLQFSLCPDQETIRALENYLMDVLVQCESEHSKQTILGYILELMVTRRCDKEIIQQFLQENLVQLDVDLTEQILQPHGLFQMCNYYADLKQDHEKVVANNINAENYNEAVSKLKMLQADQKQLLELVAKYSYVLMKHTPQNTLDVVRTLPKFDPVRLIGALLNVSQLSRDVAIDFMEHCVFKMHCPDKTFNNLFVFYLTAPVKLDRIMKYLYLQQKIMTDKGTPNFDMLFACRQFKQKKLLLPQIQVQSMLGKHDIAVSLALKNNLVSVAKESAAKCEDSEKQKTLWITIVIWMLGRGDESIKEVVQLTREIDNLKIEDILPYMTQSIKLDYFKSEICETLRNYHDQVSNLKLEMDGFYSAGDSLKKEYGRLANRNLYVPRNQKCEECYRPLFTEDYIVFGCLHCFHRDCLWYYIKRNEDIFHPKKVSKLHDISIQLAVYESSKPSKLDDNKPKQGTKVPKIVLEKEFEDLLTQECVICGVSIVDTILLPLDSNEQVEESWFV